VSAAAAPSVPPSPPLRSLASHQCQVSEETRRQKRICEKLGLLGFVFLGDHGIKGILSGPMEAVKAYVQAMGADRIFQAHLVPCSDVT
jgi:predicted sulfurtransferase